MRLHNGIIQSVFESMIAHDILYRTCRKIFKQQPVRNTRYRCFRRLLHGEAAGSKNKTRRAAAAVRSVFTMTFGARQPQRGDGRGVRRGRIASLAPRQHVPRLVPRGELQTATAEDNELSSELRTVYVYDASINIIESRVNRILRRDVIIIYITQFTVYVL